MQLVVCQWHPDCHFMLSSGMDKLGFNSWQKQEILLFSKIVQTISGVHQTSYWFSTISFSPVIMLLKHEAAGSCPYILPGWRISQFPLVPSFLRWVLNFFWVLNTHANAHAHTHHTHPHVRAHIHMNTRTHTCTNTHIHTHTYTHAHTNTHIHTRAHTHTQTHTHTHKHIQTHTNTHKHTHPNILHAPFYVQNLHFD